MGDRLVELKRYADVGFGFSVIGGVDTHIPPMICALVRDSPALLSGQVLVGDVLLKVNGVNVTNMPTKHIVDLIRNCKDSIFLLLKEDHMAKVKARPFLAEDCLIDPPRSATSSSSSLSSTSERQFTTRTPSAATSPSSATTKISDHRNQPSSLSPVSTMQPLNIHKSMSNSNSPHLSPSYESDVRPFNKNPSSAELNDYQQSLGIDVNVKLRHKTEISHARNVDNLSNLQMTPNISPNSTVSSHSHSSNQSHRSNHSLRSADRVSEYAIDVPDFSHIQSYNQQHTEHDGVSIGFEAVDGVPSKNAQHFRNAGGENRELVRTSSFTGKRERPTVNVTMDGHQRTSTNYSSTPNIVDSCDAESIQREHKNMTMTPNTQSTSELLSSRLLGYHDNERDCDDVIERTYSRSSSTSNAVPVTGTGHLTPRSQSGSSLPTHSDDGDRRNSSSSARSTETSSSKTKDSERKSLEDVDPVDLASRLFTLNGYSDNDVAPILGKNTDFAQHVCLEYLRYFNFEGLGLDDAIRLFLKKFPLTGETQERERILIHFSRRFTECNSTTDINEDAVHTLTCALMLLNTDLHGQSITTKMSQNDFITNLSGLCDGSDFPKEMLKTFYNSIKNKEILFASVTSGSGKSSPRVKKKSGSPGNPFVEVKVETNAVIMCEGMVYRKSVMDADGRRTPAMRRNWRPYYCVLKGLALLYYKPDNIASAEPQAIGIQHSLAGFAKDYKKRPFIFKLITSDWKVLYVQAKSQDEVRQWMDGINVSSAMMSAPPLPAPCGSSRRFQRPVMPISMTKLTLEQQIKCHSERVEMIEKELSEHCEFSPDDTKDHVEWESKLDYLEFELKRFKAYVTVLTTPRLERIRNRLLPFLISRQTGSVVQHASTSDGNGILPF